MDARGILPPPNSYKSDWSIATRYGLDGPGTESRWGARFSAPVHTSPGAHPASYTTGTGSFLGVKRPGRGINHPPPPSAEVNERVELYFYSPSGPSWLVVGWNFTFTSLTPQCATKYSKSCKLSLTTFKMWISFKFLCSTHGTIANGVFLQYQKPHKLLSHSSNKARANYLLINFFYFTVLYVTEGNQQKHSGRSTAQTCHFILERHSPHTFTVN